MNKAKLILKLAIYYILGFILFMLVASITYTTIFALLANDTINPQFEMQLFLQIEMQLFLQKIFYSLYWYIGVYSILYFFILYSVHKYDIYIVNKLNKRLNEMREVDKNE